MSAEFLFSVLVAYKYWMFLPVAVLAGGPVVALTAGVLTSIGYLEPIPTYIMLLVCDLVPDTVYYVLGASMDRKKFASKYGSKIGLHSNRIDVIERLWGEHTFKSMLVSKWAYGLSGPLLMSAGLVHMPIARYFFYTFSITMAQYVVLYWLGFTYGSSYKLLVHNVHVLGIVVAGTLVLTVVGYMAFTRFVRRSFLRSEEQL